MIIKTDKRSTLKAVRNFKVKTKVSGLFKSGQDAYARLKSLSETVKKKGENTFELFVNLAHFNYQSSQPAE